jgi:hypothetical protein
MEEWTPKKVYFYAVLAVLLTLILINVSNLVWQVVQITILPPTPGGRWSYESARQQLLWEKYGTTTGSVEVSPQEVQAFIAEKQKEEQQLALRYNWQALLKDVLFLAIIVPLYWYHWKELRRMEKRSQ